MRRVLIVVAIALVVLLLAGWAAAPLLLRGAVTRAIGRSGAWQADIGKVGIAWRDGAVRLSDVRVRPRGGGADALSAPEVKVGWDWRSLLGTPRLWVSVHGASATLASSGGGGSLSALRERLLGTREVWIEKVEADGPDWVVRGAGPPLRLVDARLVLTDLRNRPVAKGADEPRLVLDAQTATGGELHVELSGDPLAETPRLNLTARSDGLPLPAEGALALLGRSAGGLQLGVDADVRGRGYRGTAKADVAAPGAGSGLLGKLGERLPGAEDVTGRLARGWSREVAFAGNLPQNATVPGVVREVLEGALRRVASSALPEAQGRRPSLKLPSVPKLPSAPGLPDAKDLPFGR